MSRSIQVVLLSTYDLGRQPFGVASPARWLSDEGCEVTCQDLAVEKLDEGRVREADLIGLFLPMHTATILAARLMERLQALNPQACIACYGLYAPLNEGHLRALGATVVLGGEFEPGLVALTRRLAAGNRRTRRSP